jgi:histidine triad (HIT) family protein
MTEETIFSKIIRREIPADIVYQDDYVTAFRDINPQAPVHILVVPNKVIPTTNHAAAEDEAMLGRLFTAAARIAQDEGIADSGYRLLVNNGPDAGQEVDHLHVHILGGRRLGPMLVQPGS